MAKQMYFVTEIRTDDFDAGEPPPEKGRFKLVSQCSDGENRQTAAVFLQVKSLKANDSRVALLGLKHFVKLAQLGKPFNQLCDKKIVHEAFESFYCAQSKKNETVWRYRHGDVRILFYYANDKVVLLANALVKRTSRLSESEKNSARQAVIAFLKAAQSMDGLNWVMKVVEKEGI